MHVASCGFIFWRFPVHFLIQIVICWHQLWVDLKQFNLNKLIFSEEQTRGYPCVMGYNSILPLRSIDLQVPMCLKLIRKQTWLCLRHLYSRPEVYLLSHELTPLLVCVAHQKVPLTRCYDTNQHNAWETNIIVLSMRLNKDIILYTRGDGRDMGSWEWNLTVCTRRLAIYKKSRLHVWRMFV